MSTVTFGVAPYLYGFSCILIISAAYAFQKLVLDTWGYLFGDSRIYATPNWKDHVNVDSMMYILRTGFHVVALVSVGNFYTAMNLRDGWLLSMSILIVTRNVFEMVYELWFILSYKYEAKSYLSCCGARNTNVYFLDLSTMRVSSRSKDSEGEGSYDDKETRKLYNFSTAACVIDYMFLFGYLIMSTSYAVIATGTVQGPQILLIIGCALICLNLIMNGATAGISNYHWQKVWDIFMGGDFGKVIDLPSLPSPPAKANESEYAEKDEESYLLKNNTKRAVQADIYMANSRIDMEEEIVHALSQYDFDSDTQCIRGLVDSTGKKTFKIIDKADAANLDSLFPEKQAGVHWTQVRGFMHPFTGKKDLLYPHVTYDTNFNHRLVDVPLFGIYNPNLTGKHVVFFRIMGFGIGTSTTLNTYEALKAELLFFDWTFFMLLLQNYGSATCATIVTNLPPLLLSTNGQKQEYVTLYFYYKLFYFALACVIPKILPIDGQYTTRYDLWNVSYLNSTATSYDSVMEYMAPAVALVTINCISFLSFISAWSTRNKRSMEGWKLKVEEEGKREEKMETPSTAYSDDESIQTQTGKLRQRHLY